MRLIAFTGPKGSGKDTAAARLTTRNALEGKEFFKRIAFAGPIKQMCQIAFGLTIDECEVLELKEKPLDRWPFLPPRKLLQDEANHFRDVYGGDVWVKAWLRSVEESAAGCILVTDLRFPEEVERIKALGGIIVYVRSNFAEENLQRSQAEGDPLATNISEQHWPAIKAAADYVLDNNSSLDNLFDQVEEVVIASYGHWNNWRNVPNTFLHDLRTRNY